MEFMYCIPDLEVFIDKTIKKCLLEYDLDANDTEAVLDDMEKAWPKSPQQSPQEIMTKGCNGNTETGRVSMDQFGANRVQGAVFSNRSIDTATIKGYQSERLNSDVDLSTANGLVQSPSVGGDCSRSDTSSPDAGDGKLQKQRHSKLKSRLQQRYFEGSKSRSATTGPTTQDAIHAGLYDTAGTLAPNNLHLLASAANLHTKRSIGARVRGAEISGYLKEQTTSNVLETATKSFPKGNSRENRSSIDIPDETQMLYPLPSSSSSSSSSLPEMYNSNGCTTVAGPHHHHGVVTKRQESQADRSTLHFRDSEEETFGNVRVLGNRHNGLSLNEGKVKYTETISDSDVKDLGKLGSPTARPLLGIHYCEEEVVSRSKLQDKACPAFVTEEKAKRLFEHYQKGYHSVIPRDVVVVRKELSPCLEVDDLADRKTMPRLSATTQKGNLEVKKMKRLLSPSSGGDFEDKFIAKQLFSKSEKGYLEFGKTRPLSSRSERRDLEVKKMRKQLPFFHNEGNLEVRKRQSPREIPYSSLSFISSDQRPVSAPNCYHLASPADGLEFTQPHGFKPGGFFNQQQYYTSRIASIIFEELEKDNKQSDILPTEIIPSSHKLSPETPPQFGHRNTNSSTQKSNSLLPYKPQVGLFQMDKRHYSVKNAHPLLENNSKSVPQILPAHSARPSHNSLSALLAFQQGPRADIKDHKVAAFSCIRDKTGLTCDDNIQPEDLSVRSNTSVQARDMPIGQVSTKSSPNAVEEQSHGYFSSPTSPVLTSLLSCHTQPSQVLQKSSSSPSPCHNHKKEIAYSSDSETAITSYKTLGKWERKGQVHGLGIHPKGNSKAVVKKRAETLKVWSVSGESLMKKAKPPHIDGIITELQR